MEYNKFQDVKKFSINFNISLLFPYYSLIYNYIKKILIYT